MRSEKSIRRRWTEQEGLGVTLKTLNTSARSSSSDRLLLMEETDDNGQEFKEEKDNMGDNTFSFDTPVVLAVIKKIVILERNLTF